MHNWVVCVEFVFDNCGIMGLRIVVYALLLAIGFRAGVTLVECNLEVDALYAWKSKLVDPNNVLQSWEQGSTSPCTWFHVACNSRGRVTRVDLGSAGLSGPLIPELGLLSELQYFKVFENRISGSIPSLFGNLTNLISLELQGNLLSGSIPPTLGNLRYLKYLRLNKNNLTGMLPLEVIQLVRWGNLAVLDVSLNQLEGTIGGSNVTVTTVIQDGRAPS